MIACLPKAVLGYGWPAEAEQRGVHLRRDFASLDQLGWVYARAQSAGLVQRCSSLLHRTRALGSAAARNPRPGLHFEAQKLFDAQLEYLFVIARVRELGRAPPVPRAGRLRRGHRLDAGAPDAGSIDAGAARQPVRCQ